MTPGEWATFEMMLSKEEQDAIGISKDRNLTQCITRLAWCYSKACEEAGRVVPYVEER